MCECRVTHNFFVRTVGKRHSSVLIGACLLPSEIGVGHRPKSFGTYSNP